MSTCDETGCTGHLGKFPDCQTEALWTVSLDSGQDEQTGSVDAHGWFALMIMTSDKPVELDDGRTVTVPAGNYMVGTNDQGFVWSWQYDTEAEARKDFETADNEYGEWLDANEPEPLAANAGSAE